MTRSHHLLLFAQFVLATVAPEPLQSQGVRTVTASDSAAVVATVRRFHDAVSRGDSATALEILASDALIVESGDVDTRAEYRSHHLPADIGYARAVPTSRTLVSVVVNGNSAWLVSRSGAEIAGMGPGAKPAGAELMVLTRRDRSSPWRIRAAHWSSHQRTP